MTPLRVAVDFDGTLARVNDFACAVMTAQGFPRTTRDLRDYNSVRETPAAERAFWVAYDILDQQPRIRAALEPYDCVTAEALWGICNRWGPNVHIVSANAEAAKPGILSWMWANAPAIAWKLGYRCLGRQGPSKATLGYDVLIDDSPKLAAECPIVRRFRSWGEVYELIDAVEKARRRGHLPGPVLLLANARWNESIEDKGEL